MALFHLTYVIRDVDARLARRLVAVMQRDADNTFRGRLLPSWPSLPAAQCTLPLSHMFHAIVSYDSFIRFDT
jgi:hypothetical protein